MKSSSTIRLGAIAVAAAVCGGVAAKAEQYRVVVSDSGTICESGTKSEPVVIEGRDVVTIAQAEGDTLNTAVCMGEGSQGNLHVQWKAGDIWKSTGNIGIGCAEILGASNVKVRAVEPYLVQAASYYTCTKE
ncbi:MAG TPA: hypothetical protein VJ822_12660 [Dongiaceae bacterium]|nr:hypothetical protein [Dongiaceae bacterium]